MPRFTEREFQEHLGELLVQMRQDATPFPKDPKARAARLAKARKNHLFFAKTYLPHYFYEGFAPFHREMSQAAQVSGRPVLIVSGGGLGKTSIVTITEALHALLFKTHPFVVTGGMTEDLATQNTSMVKLELDENERIRQDFGVQRGGYRWEDGDLVTAAGCRLKARGAGQAFRGLRWRQHRPSLVILDDIEDEELCRSERRVQKVLTWILAVVWPRMEAKGARLVIVANVLNRTGVIGTLLHNPDHKDVLKKVFPAETEGGRSAWPARFPKAALEKLRSILGHVRYCAEMLCSPVDDSHYFRPEMTQFYDVKLLPQIRDVVVWLDPSILESKQGDFKAMVAWGRLPDDHRDYCCGAWIRHAALDDLVAAAYALWERLRFTVLYIEGVAFQRHLKRDFDREAQRRGFSLPIKIITSVGPKDLDIERLVAPHDSGDVLFCRSVGDTQTLLDQFYSWEPKGRSKDDGPDAAARGWLTRAGRRRQARFRAPGLRDYKPYPALIRGL